MNVHTIFTGVANAHIVETPQGLALVDAGMPRQATRILNRIRALGHSPQDVRVILVTHGHIDHAGSAVALKQLTGAPIALHPADVPLVATPDLKIPPGRTDAIDAIGRFISKFGWVVPLETFKPDICLVDGQSLLEFGLKAQVVHTPGHTSGSVTFHFEDGTSFVGDAILNLIRVSFPLVWEDRQAAYASACKIRSLNPKQIFTGHGRAFNLEQLERFVDGYCVQNNENPG